MVTVATDKVGVNVPSTPAIDIGSDPYVKTTDAETIGGKPNDSLLLFPFPNLIS